MIYVANVAEEDLPDGRGNPQVEAVRRKALEEGAEVVVVSARLEAELAEPPGRRRGSFSPPTASRKAASSASPGRATAP